MSLQLPSFGATRRRGREDRLHYWNVRTRQRAVERLIKEFPERFAEILADERENGLDARPDVANVTRS